MANYLPNKCDVFDGPFQLESFENIITNTPKTGGVDLYITQDRVILLDTQVIFV